MLEWLEFEEKVGRIWHNWASSNSASYPRYPDAAVSLEQLAPALAVFFRLAGGPAGVAVSALAARSSGHRLSLRQRLGVDREQMATARLDEENLLLPPEIALFQASGLNRDLYFWLAALLAVTEPPAETFKDPLRQDITALREAVRSTELALATFPGLQARYNRLRAALLAARPQRQLPPAEAAVEAVICHLLGAGQPLDEAAGRLLAAVLDPAMILREFRAPASYRRPLPVPLWASYSPQGHSERPPADEDDELPRAPDAQAEVKHKRKAERRHQDQAERDDPLVLNRFEKILSLAEMVNVNRAIDDDEDKNASDNAGQMDEITLSRNKQRASSQLKMDLDLSPGEGESQPLIAELTYPEWNFRAQAHLPDHCRVISEPPAEEAEGRAMDEQTRRRIRRVRRQFEALRPRREWRRAQLSGSELDMDAVIRAHCDRAAMGDNSECQYMDARPQARDLAVSILVDVSLSTDAWVEDRRVIDIEKEALLVLAHGLASCGDDYCIQSFTSHRRQRVWVNTLKSFGEPMGERIQRRIAALKPGRYTRMGAAIRHSAEQLRQCPNRHRLLLVLSDGKPSDVDYYEGRYALEDTRRAVLEARRADLRVFGITIDQDAQSYISHLFGRGGYAMVRKPEHLAQALPGIYRQIVSS
ncbi:protein norD [Seongchinamella sediminis]|uniref:Protein norD n=1 Tax=Seongchinamella sediminis TaxID=2283635 RepID=A0A3L7E1Q9_9GAMM|nr:protein norD [Seongchinamella sediminis]RLQ23837.1 protein norD [Seongchinamella sediminis]